MQESTVTAIQAIQAILAPALGISAVGLLLLGVSNRYSSMVNRIRLLTDEKRDLAKKLVNNNELEYADTMRLESITKQTEELLIRSRFARNGILSLQFAVVSFVLASVGISLNLFFSSAVFQSAPLLVFSIGMISVLIGVLFAAIEVYRSYKIILIEVKAEE